MTYTLPFLRTILQPSQIRLTLDLTFTTTSPEKPDPPNCPVPVRSYLESRSSNVGNPRITNWLSNLVTRSMTTDTQINNPVPPKKLATR